MIAGRWLLSERAVRDSNPPDAISVGGGAVRAGRRVIAGWWLLSVRGGVIAGRWLLSEQTVRDSHPPRAISVGGGRSRRDDV